MNMAPARDFFLHSAPPRVAWSRGCPSFAEGAASDVSGTSMRHGSSRGCAAGSAKISARKERTESLRPLVPDLPWRIG